MRLALPFVLYHSAIIDYAAMLMSFFGGVLIYLTILGYVHFCKWSFGFENVN